MTSTTYDSSESDTKQAAHTVAEGAKDKAVDVQQTAKAEARSVANDAKNQASEVLATTRSQLRDQASEQTKTLSSTMRDISEQLRGMADNSDQPEAQVATLAKSAADSLGSRADRLEVGGLDELIGDLKRFARNRPGTFLLGSVTLGFAVGRLAKHADLREAGEVAKQEFGTDAPEPSPESTSESSASTARIATPIPPAGVTAQGLLSDGRP